MKPNFDKTVFALVDNADVGEVDSSVIFEYSQEGDLVTAEYHGGTIKYGKIIAHHKGDHLDMLYQCITTDDELRAGKAIAQIIVNADNIIELLLDWEWLNGGQEKGTSKYIQQK